MGRAERGHDLEQPREVSSATVYRQGPDVLHREVRRDFADTPGASLVCCVRMPHADPRSIRHRMDGRLRRVIVSLAAPVRAGGRLDHRGAHPGELFRHPGVVSGGPHGLVPAPRLFKVAHEISLAHRGTCWCRPVEGLVVLAVGEFPDHRRPRDNPADSACQPDPDLCEQDHLSTEVAPSADNAETGGP